MNKATVWRRDALPQRRPSPPELGTLQDGGPADVLFAPDRDPDLAERKASVILVLRNGRPLLARCRGLISALGAGEREVAPGLFLEERLAAWSARLGIDARSLGNGGGQAPALRNTSTGS